MNMLRKLVIKLLRFIRNILFSNPKLRSLLYDYDNKEEFRALYEHEKMLADSVRTDTYKRAIQKYIGTEDVVLDLGTGSGILSFFAAKQNAKKIYAIDHSNFIKIAQKIAKHNNLQNIEFVQTNSRDFQTKVKFDVIIHEQIGDYLFNENMIENLLDLKKRLLKPEGRIIPGKFELFLEPVSLNENFNVPFIWENNIYGIDFSFLKNHYESLEEFKSADYTQEWLDADAVKKIICDPIPVLVFDLNEMNSAKEILQIIECSKKIKIPGTLDGFCLYFKVIFDGEIEFDTSPLTENTHWGNCFFRIESRKCYEGEIINFKFKMPDLLDIKTWSVSKPSFKKQVSNKLDSAD